MEPILNLQKITESFFDIAVGQELVTSSKLG